MKILAQTDYISAGTIFKDSYVTVELQVKLNNPCAGGGTGKPSRYRYVIIGRTRGYDYYLNWKMDYYNCNQSITAMTNHLNIGSFPREGVNENIDWTFDGNLMETAYYDVNQSLSPDNSPSRIKALVKSVAPKYVEGRANIDYGEKVTLTARGGILGVKGKWAWYRNSCGAELIGNGESISVKPEESAEYFVRAESPSDVSTCASLRINVNLESKAPDHIEGRKVLCFGEKNIPLSVSGGSLGKNAEWVWYQDSIKGIPIGRGSEIRISPTARTTYYVRAEGPTNNTNFKNLTVNIIDERIRDPERIIGKTSLCSGEYLELKVIGTLDSTSASWCWYKNTVDDKSLVKKGSVIKINPTSNTVYYVRGEGACAVTKEQSINIQVEELSINPSYINSSVDPHNKRRTALSIVGGSLANDAKWVWHKGNCESGSVVGDGETISVKVNKETVFLVRAEGKCNVTNCTSTKVYPSQIDKFGFINIGVVKSFSSTSGDFSEFFQSPTLSATIGKLAKMGWYIRGKYNISSKPVDYTIEGNNVNNFSSQKYYTYNGKKVENRWAATGGLIMRLSHNVYFQIGAGYGGRDLMWGIDEYSNANNSFVKESWGKNLQGSYSGPEAEAGILFKIGFMNLSFGVNGIAYNTSGSSTNNQKVFIDGIVGIGINF